MRLSPRLKAVLSFVEGRTLVDIGTDHGYIPIAACTDRGIEKAYACDINLGPLRMAYDNIKRHGLEHRIFIRCGFGFQAIDTDDDIEDMCIVVSGIGGLNITDILNDPALKKNHINRLVIQPQKDTPLVRRTLHANGFEIIDETMLVDSGIFYTIVVAEPKSEISTYTEAGYLLGKCLLDKGDQTLQAYVELQLSKFKRSTRGVPDKYMPIYKEALECLQQLNGL